MRSYDLDVLRQRAAEYPEMFQKIDFESWLNDDNIMLEDDGSVSLFTMEYPGVYTGHYLFKVRGKEAHDLAVKMLDWMFSRDAKVIRGEIDVDNRKSISITRRLGFTSYGVTDSPVWGKYEHFIMTADEFKDKFNG